MWRLEIIYNISQQVVVCVHVVTVLMIILTNIVRILSPSQPPSPPPLAGDTPRCGNHHISHGSEMSS